MKKYLLFFLLIAFISGAIHADIMTELAKRDKKNPINIGEYTSYVLYAKDGYLHTEYWADGFGVPSIVAYQIQENTIKLIIRIKTWDLAFRIYDRFYERDGIDEFTVDVHDYYLVELVYVNDKLETYCNRIRNINANGFIYNDAKIGSNINKAFDYYTTYPRLKTEPKEGMNVKIVTLTNERTNELAENGGSFETYDYYYQVLIDDEQVRINGYLLDFSNNIEYRSKLLTIKSGNTPWTKMPEDAVNYLGTWRYSGDGGLGMETRWRIITVTITADEFVFHYKGYNSEYRYTLSDLTWTKIIRPDEDFHRYVEMLEDYYKGAEGYIITGTVKREIGDYPKQNTFTEYVYVTPDNSTFMLWYNANAPNHLLWKQK